MAINKQENRVSSLFDLNESKENIARENVRYTEAELIFATDDSLLYPSFSI